jgi:DNA-binding IclR family transcriptional regulator
MKEMKDISKKRKKRPSEVQSITRAVSLLTSLSKGLNNLTRIADECHLSNSTTHRILGALSDSGLVVQDPIKHRYYLGPFIASLSNDPQITHAHLVVTAVDEMRRLWVLSGETVTIAVFIGLQTIPLFALHSKYDLKVTQEEKRATTAWSGCVSRVFLSQLEESKLLKTLESMKTKKILNSDTPDISTLITQIEQTRKRGYAVSRGERIKGAMGISVAIVNYFCPVALTILGPVDRVKSSQNMLIKELLKSAKIISISL